MPEQSPMTITGPMTNIFLTEKVVKFQVNNEIFIGFEKSNKAVTLLRDYLQDLGQVTIKLECPMPLKRTLDKQTHVNQIVLTNHTKIYLEDQLIFFPAEQEQDVSLINDAILKLINKSEFEYLFEDEDLYDVDYDSVCNILNTKSNTPTKIKLGFHGQEFEGDKGPKYFFGFQLGSSDAEDSQPTELDFDEIGIKQQQLNDFLNNTNLPRLPFDIYHTKPKLIVFSGIW